MLCFFLFPRVPNHLVVELYWMAVLICSSSTICVNSLSSSVRCGRSNQTWMLTSSVCLWFLRAQCPAIFATPAKPVRGAYVPVQLHLVCVLTGSGGFQKDQRLADYAVDFIVGDMALVWHAYMILLVFTIPTQSSDTIWRWTKYNYIKAKQKLSHCYKIIYFFDRVCHSN